MFQIAPLAADLPTTETALVVLGLSVVITLLWLLAYFR